LEDSADALEVTEVATLDSLLVSSCFLAAANDTNESSLLEDVLIGVDANGPCEVVDSDDVNVDCFEEPGEKENHSSHVITSELQTKEHATSTYFYKIKNLGFIFSLHFRLKTAHSSKPEAKSD